MLVHRHELRRTLDERRLHGADGRERHLGTAELGLVPTLTPAARLELLELHHEAVDKPLERLIAQDQVV